MNEFLMGNRTVGQAGETLSAAMITTYKVI